MRRRRLLTLLFLLGLAACQDVAPAPPPALTATPSLALLRLGLTDGAAPLASLATKLLPLDDDLRIQFIEADDAALLADVIAGSLDAALLHQLPADAPVWFNPVALDGLVIVVHPDNPLRSLRRGEARALFNGRFTHWSEIASGGFDAPIQLVTRPPGAGARAIFRARVMSEQRISINAIVQPTQADLLAAVATDPGAVGYAFVGALDGHVAALALDGVAATPASLADQSYALTVPLYFVAAAEPVGALRLFLARLQDRNGQEVLGEKYGRVR